MVGRHNYYGGIEWEKGNLLVDIGIYKEVYEVWHGGSSDYLGRLPYSYISL
jgi:hypothetical protein